MEYAVPASVGVDVNKLASIAALVLAATALVVALWNPREPVQAAPPPAPPEQPQAPPRTSSTWSGA